MIDLRNDPRWLRLSDPYFTAGPFTGGSFELDIDRPAIWTGGDPVGGDDDFDPDNFLSQDFCIIDDRQFLIHCNTELPILGGGGKALAFGIWAEISRASFGAYFNTFDEPDQSGLGQLAGSFANRLSGFAETLGQPCTLRPRGGRHRPLVLLNDMDHPLAQAQRHGITLDRLLDLYAASGIDLKQAVTVSH